MGDHAHLVAVSKIEDYLSGGHRLHGAKEFSHPFGPVANSSQAPEDQEGEHDDGYRYGDLKQIAVLPS